MPKESDKVTVAVLHQRVVALEQLAARMDERFESIDHSMKQVVELSVRAVNTNDAIQRAFSRLESLEGTLHGRNNSIGLVAQVQAHASKIEGHMWALRTIAAAFIVQTVGVISYLVANAFGVS